MHCTPGFAAFILNTSTTGLPTAGPCNALGDTLSQGTSYGVTGPLGTVTIRSYTNYAVDAEFINASATGTTVDPDVNTSTPWGQNVSTTGTSFVGLSPCLDGARTGENCYGSLQPVDFCFVELESTVCHVTKVTESPLNPILCQSGDSGGPVYTGTGRLTAYGILQATTDGYTCWYSEIQAVVSQLGTPLLTTGISIPTPSSLGNTLQNQLLNVGQYLSSSTTTLYCVTVWKYFFSMEVSDGNWVLYSPHAGLG